MVYTETNAAAGNEILALRRDRAGRLSPDARYPTGGLGDGASLGSQGAVVLTPDRRHLLAVNAGSNDVTAFALTRHGLRRVGSAPSGGTRPVSVAAARGLVYVVNAGGTPTVSGFRLDKRGLRPIAGSTREVAPGGAGPAQIGFTPSGRRLVVTLKPSNRIDTFALDSHGRPAAPVSTPSTGATPFGYSFNTRGHLLVSNAEGGAPGASSVTSYRLKRDGKLAVVSGPVRTGQSAACWLVTTPDNRFAYTTNTASDNLSTFAVRRTGSLALTAGVAATAAGGPIDAAITSGGRLLYTLTGQSVVGFSIDRASGRLTRIDTLAGLPAGLVGLAA